jgi:hypothetical protein
LIALGVLIVVFFSCVYIVRITFKDIKRIYSAHAFSKDFIEHKERNG